MFGLIRIIVSPPAGKDTIMSGPINTLNEIFGQARTPRQGNAASVCPKGT
jgi:hypothetical protein